MMNKEEKEIIVSKLNELIKNIKCPMCGNNHFIISDDYSQIMVQDSISGIKLGTTMPSACVICSHCGFASFHVIGVVAPDLMNKEKQENIENK